MEPINYIFILVVPSLMLWIVYRAWIAAKDFQKMPTFREYVKNFPGLGGKGAKCYKCNSTHLRNLGVTGINDTDRIVRCGHCDTVLYRTTR